MQYNPYPFQAKAIQMICSNPGAAMLLDPGMGKTGIALAAVTVLQHHKAIGAALVIAPLRPMYLTWPAEIKKWTQFSHLKVSIIHGTPEERRKAIETPADIYLMNPENTDWLVTESCVQFGTQPDLLIVDESTRFKNPSSKRFKALKHMLPSFKRRLILTGTPAPQSIEDMFAQIQIVDDGQRLGRYITYFRKQFMDPEDIRVGGGKTVTNGTRSATRTRPWRPR